MTTKHLPREERRHIRVALNGHSGFERQIVAADSLDGWPELVYGITKSRFSQTIRVGWQAPDDDEWIPVVFDAGVRL